MDDFGQQDAGGAGIWIWKPYVLWKGTEQAGFFDEVFIWRVLFSRCCRGISVIGRILMCN